MQRLAMPQLRSSTNAMGARHHLPLIAEPIDTEILVASSLFLLPVIFESSGKEMFCPPPPTPPHTHHPRSRWRHACRVGADGDVTGEYDELESEHPSKRQKLPGQVGVLMVCQSNLARSPAAAAVFYQKAAAVGTAEQFFVDSCGLGGGNPVS